jgi:hypothetical protein
VKKPTSKNRCIVYSLRISLETFFGIILEFKGSTPAITESQDRYRLQRRERGYHSTVKHRKPPPPNYYKKPKREDSLSVTLNHHGQTRQSGHRALHLQEDTIIRLPPAFRVSSLKSFSRSSGRFTMSQS